MRKLRVILEQVIDDLVHLLHCDLMPLVPLESVDELVVDIGSSVRLSIKLLKLP
jgi:hypothetical protein